MVFNVGKWKVTHFSRSNPSNDYFMKKQKLESTQIEKDLGILISSDLKVSQQCQQAYAKASKSLGMINRTITNKPTKILLQLYKLLVRPHLEYCTAAWSPHYQKDKMVPEKVQRRFTRTIPGLRKFLYETRLKHINLWTLEDRHYTSRPDRGLQNGSWAVCCGHWNFL